ncbi:riboflavin synthase [Candidatus Microgenomates bacterium]|nr:riboflavin synthase [Candidatus Microgenomates bacterium]
MVQYTSGSLTLAAPHDMFTKLTDGMSIAVNGVCLTAVGRTNPNLFRVEYMPETDKKTAIGTLKTGERVNLELPVTTETLFAGHIVQGHVDDVATILSIEDEGNSRIFTFRINRAIAKYLVNKGSITVNGISLTVIHAERDTFSVGIIPHTWDNTMLHQTRKGDKVNIEVDIIAKYVEKLTQTK